MSEITPKVTVVGAGFAGVEAVWALAQAGVPVELFEMRPVRMTPAHTTSWFAELVCSNSLKSKKPDSPAGQLKAEMQALGSIVLETAYEHEVPAGQALGVDREAFGEAITRKLEAHPLITVRREEFTPEMAEAMLSSVAHRSPIPNDGLAHALVLATGPLTSPEMADWLAEQTGRKHLYFYDAVSPTVDASSIDMSIAFSQSRYDKGEGDDYINCPFTKEEYETFIDALLSAERAPIHAFEAGGVRTDAVVDPGYKLDAPVDLEAQYVETIKYFAGCMPVEAIADRGRDSLRFGNFKPVGLTDPRTGRRPYAALQLRPENREKTLYSLVACQTRLKFGEQKRVFQLIPGLQNAEFVRYGVIHRNTYLEAPTCLTPELEMRSRPGLFVAGQLTGVEGYVESAAMGIYVGQAIAARLSGRPFVLPERACAYGSLLSHLMDDTEREFAPMNINWGLFPDPEPFVKDKGRRREVKIENARAAANAWTAAIQNTRT